MKSRKLSWPILGSMHWPSKAPRQRLSTISKDTKHDRRVDIHSLDPVGLQVRSTKAVYRVVYSVRHLASEGQKSSLSLCFARVVVAAAVLHQQFVNCRRTGTTEEQSMGKHILSCRDRLPQSWHPIPCDGWEYF